MSKKAVSKKQTIGRRQDQKLMAIPLIVLLIKFILLFSIPNHAWIGADGENYIGGLDGLRQDGYFSTNTLLSYWPAGYPLVMYVFGSVSPSNTLVIMAILQSILYAASSIIFVRELTKTHLAKFSFWVAWILAINPTLSLSSMVIGYEIIPASIFLLAIALFMRDFRLKNKSVVSTNSAVAASLMSLSCFVQPRFLLTSAIFFTLWAFMTRTKKVIPLFMGVTILITALLPISLALRNSNANGYNAISTNLGITMNLGAGSGASGKYNPNGKYGVPCSEVEGNAAQKDSHLVGCVIEWYLKNPTEAAPLVIRKAKYFWAPWFGPEVAGSMNRNPWLQNHPFKSLATNTAEGNNLVYGPVGKLISWTWMVGGLVFIYLGFRRMWKARGLVRNLGLFSIMIVVTNWVISVGTLGDHRQRVPIMTLSLFLQCVGFLSLFGKKWLIQKDISANETVK
jgi:hypothetical protein